MLKLFLLPFKGSCHLKNMTLSYLFLCAHKIWTIAHIFTVTLPLFHISFENIKNISLRNIMSLRNWTSKSGSFKSLQVSLQRKFLMSHVHFILVWKLTSRNLEKTNHDASLPGFTFKCLFTNYIILVSQDSSIEFLLQFLLLEVTNIFLPCIFLQLAGAT